MSGAVVNRKRAEFLAGLVCVVTMYLLRGRLGDRGIGYLFVAAALSQIWWVLLGEDVGENFGKLLRARISKGQRGNAILLSRAVFGQQLILGIAGGIALGISCYALLPKLFGMGEARYMGWFLAPAFCFRSIGEGYAGYASGRGTERPGIVSAFLRAALFLIFGLLLGNGFQGYGERVAALLRKEEFASVYAGYGVCVAAGLAELLSGLFLFGVRVVLARSPIDDSGDGFRARDQAGGLLLSLLSRRGTDILNRVLLVLPALFWIPIRLASRGLSERSVAEETGEYVTGYGLLLLVCLSLGAVIVLPLAARCSQSMKKDGMRHARAYFQSGFHLAVVIGAFGMAYFAALGDTIAAVIAPLSQDVLGDVIFAGSIAALFAVPAFFFYKIMSLRGQGVFTAVTALVAALVSSFALRLMLGGELPTPVAISYALDIWAAALCIGFAAAATIRLGMNFELVGSIGIPLVSAIVVGLVNLFLAKAFSPHLGNLFSAVLLLLLMCFAYLIVLLLLRNFEEREVRMLPGGKWIEALGQMLHVM